MNELDVPRRPFPLFRVYFVVSLVVIVLTSWLVAETGSRGSRKELLREAESFAESVCRNVNFQIHREILWPVVREGGSIQLDDPKVYAALDRVIRSAIYGKGVRTVVLFDLEGEIVYSTNRAHLGHAFPENPGVRAGREGRLFSRLRLKATSSDIDGSPLRDDLLEVYVPLAQIAAEDHRELEIAGVLEVYLNAEPILSSIARTRGQMFFRTALSMSGLFLVLSLLVFRADRLIRRQHRALRRQSEELEQRVQERTSALVDAQDRLVQVAKMASLGTMAAGVAHEINNPLGSVAACAEGLLERAATAPFRDAPAFRDFPEYLGIIRGEAFRCKGITDKLLDFSRQRPPSVTSVSLRDVLDDTLALLGHQKAARSDRVNVTGDRDARVRADAGEMKQVVLNLVQNALDAIDGRPDGRVEVHVRATSDPVVLIVRDNGCGIRPEDRPRIFDPFFTTKEPGQGTGLGLAMCERIVESQGGEIRVESPGPGRGTTIEVRLPRSEDPA